MVMLYDLPGTNSQSSRSQGGGQASVRVEARARPRLHFGQGQARPKAKMGPRFAISLSPHDSLVHGGRCHQAVCNVR